MANPGIDGFFATGPRLQVNATDCANGDRLLLLGASEAVAIELTRMYRAAQRSSPVCQVFVTAANALEKLADQSFDCVLVLNSCDAMTPRGIDAVSFCNAVRAAGCQDAVLVLSETANDSLWRAVCEADGELYVGPRPWYSVNLVMLIDRAVQQRARARESERRSWAERQRLERERAECSELISQQRRLLSEAGDSPFGTLEGLLPPELPGIYRELLRTYVMTGTVSLATEISKLAQTFAMAHLTPRQVLQLHLEQVDLLIRGIGQRSARHLIDRANLLCLELMLLLCEFLRAENSHTWWAWQRRPVADVGLSLERRAA